MALITSKELEHAMLNALESMRLLENRNSDLEQQNSILKQKNAALTRDFYEAIAARDRARAKAKQHVVLQQAHRDGTKKQAKQAGWRKAGSRKPKRAA